MRVRDTHDYPFKFRYIWVPYPSCNPGSGSTCPQLLVSVLFGVSVVSKVQLKLECLGTISRKDTV